MATYTPISNEFIQHAADASGNSASGYYIKAYASGTSTPVSIALDSAGSTLVAKVELDSLGYVQNGSGGSTVLYIDQSYRLVLYVNSTDADANTFASAVQDIDDIPQALTQAASDEAAEGSKRFPKNFATLALAVASPTLVDGDALNIAERTTGNGGGAMWDVVLSSTVTENAFNIVQCTGVATLSLVLRTNSEVLNVAQFGAIVGGIVDATLAIIAAIDYSKSLSRPAAIYAPSGTYLVSDQGGGYCFAFDKNGMTLYGDGPWATNITCLDTATDIFRISSDKTTLYEHCTLRDFKLQSTQTGAPTTVGINAWAAPTTTIENVLMFDMHNGLVMKNAWNSQVAKVRCFDSRDYSFDIRDNTNDTCFLGCVGEGLPTSNPPASMRLESSHGVSVKGGAYENSDYAFEIIACEVTLDTYVEKCSLGVINGTAATVRTQVNILNMISFNNAENLPLFHMSSGFIQVHQLNDSASPSTIAGSVFALTGAAKAIYGVLNIDVATTIGTFASGSAGFIRPMHSAPAVEAKSLVITANAASTEFIARVFRPWKIHSISIVDTGSGLSIASSNIQIGTLTNPNSICDYTTTASTFQTVPFSTSPTAGMYQTTGSYTDQTGNIFLTTNGAGGAAGTYQVLFRYYNGCNGVSPIPNINDPDAYIADQNSCPNPISIQFMD